MSLKQQLNENNSNQQFFQQKLNQNNEKSLKSSSQTSLTSSLENFSKYVEVLPQASRRRFIASDRVTLRNSSPVKISTPLNSNNINNNYKIIFDKKVSILNNTKNDNLKQKKQLHETNESVLNGKNESDTHANENLLPINSNIENNNEKNLRGNSVFSFTS